MHNIFPNRLHVFHYPHQEPNAWIVDRTQCEPVKNITSWIFIRMTPYLTICHHYLLLFVQFSGQRAFWMQTCEFCAQFLTPNTCNPTLRAIETSSLAPLADAHINSYQSDISGLLMVLKLISFLWFVALGHKNKSNSIELQNWNEPGEIEGINFGLYVNRLRLK